jgi:hypothetical protein
VVKIYNSGWGKVGKRGEMEGTMITDVERGRLSNALEDHSESLAKLRVLLFCMKHPKLKFTTDCVAVNQGVDKVVLEEEIQNLINEGILGKQTSDIGITYYCLNKSQQELLELTERFVKDWRSQGSGAKG